MSGDKLLPTAQAYRVQVRCLAVAAGVCRNVIAVADPVAVVVLLGGKSAGAGCAGGTSRLAHTLHARLTGLSGLRSKDSASEPLQLARRFSTRMMSQTCTTPDACNSLTATCLPLQDRRLSLITRTKSKSPKGNMRVHLFGLTCSSCARKRSWPVSLPFLSNSGTVCSCPVPSSAIAMRPSPDDSTKRV